ncbi:MAG TPA: transglycosylase domain-containing protein, partial [Thermoanaerobaculia bacterium]|nr:transglycosylase domain-containing protein [Thermoanaerobaculia bacterium]
MSRPLNLPRWVVIIAAIALITGEAFAVYVFLLNRRLTRELVEHSWRAPTIIASAASGRVREVARLYGADWRITPLVTVQTLPRYVSDAFVAAEDVRFHHHIGVDPIGLARAAFANLRAHGIAQGGSTIDQQIIKGRFLSNERTWRRKIVEMLLAVALDARLSKDEILEIYLNDVYLGHSGGKPVLGVDEAARVYLGKTADRLRVDEAAMLAGIIRAPNRDTPDKRSDAVRARRDAVLHVMRDHDWITDAQLRDALARDVEYRGGSQPQAPFPYYLTELRREIVDRVGVRPVVEGGLTIVAELDPDAQRNAERIARRAPSQLEARYDWIQHASRTEPLQVAILSVDSRSGGVRALVGGSDFTRSPFDRTSNMRRQPGSAFKTFAYLAAIASKRATTASLLLDAPLKIDVSNSETWEPHNYDERYRGRVTVRES